MEKEETKILNIKSMFIKPKNSHVDNDNHFKSFDFFNKNQEGSLMKLLNSKMSSEKEKSVSLKKSIFRLSENLNLSKIEEEYNSGLVNK